MQPRKNEKSINYNTQQNSVPGTVNNRDTGIVSGLEDVFGCIYRTTLRYFKNIPHRIQNKYQRYRNEKKRLPKRRSRNRVYYLVGYTTKEKVDRRFYAMRRQLLIRRVLLILIFLSALYIAYKTIQPFQNTSEFQQIIGFDDVKEIAQSAPFALS